MNSYWMDTVKEGKEYEKLKENMETDICIIGGGITGISTAYNLARKQLKITVIEKGKVGSQTTGKSTAKVTSQHGLFYKYLKDSKGIDFAKFYYEANEEAIENIRKIIERENIGCDFEKQSEIGRASCRERV